MHGTLWVAVSTACEALIACVNQLNIMDKECGNGDYGTVISQTAKAIQDAIQDNEIVKNCPHMVFLQFSNIVTETAGDHYVGLYSLFFKAVAESLKESGKDLELTETVILDAFTAGNKAIAADERIQDRERSILDALIPAELKLIEELKQNACPIVAFAAAVTAAEKSAMQTVQAKNTNTKYKYPDPGAHAVGIWFRGAYEATKLRTALTGETL